MKQFPSLVWQCGKISLVGGWRYHLWLTVLSVFTLMGVFCYCQQLVNGLVTTGMTDHVSWGLYIANFTYLVGMAAAAAMLVIPVYVYKNLHLSDVVIFGELLAISVIVMCLLFVTVDLGRPDRFLHIFLRFNFPMSMLTWDVIALNGYLLLNIYICGYLLYCAYRGRQPVKAYYLPFVFIAIVWAISIHTVTAFLYVGLGGRPFWNSAIIAPRFLASAFAAGPAFIIICLQIVRHYTTHKVSNDALLTLRRIVQVAMLCNLFLLGCELFTEFYTDSHHVASARYLWLGLHGRQALVPWIWVALLMNLVASLLLVLPLSRGLKALNVACVLAVLGIWIEKGMGLIIPAFIPTSLGEIVEYSPTLREVMVCLGIWAFGLLLYTVLVRVSVPVLSGELTYEKCQRDNAASRLPRPEEGANRS